MMIVERKPAGTELIDVLDRVLDKGVVLDASTRIRLNTLDLSPFRDHFVVAAVQIYLRHGEPLAVARLNARRPFAAVKQHRRAELVEMNGHVQPMRRKTNARSR